MTKVLNVDALTPTENRKVQIGGEVYEVSPITVGDFLQLTQLSKQAEEAKDRLLKESEVSGEIDESASTLETIRYLVASIRVRLKSCPEEVLHLCNLGQLYAIAAYLRGDDGSEDAAEDSEEKK